MNLKIPAVLLVAMMLTACSKKAGPGDAVPVEHETPVPVGAATISVKSEPVAPRIEIIGTVGSERIIHLSARLSAYVKEINVAAGSVVTQGQTLVVLDDRDLRDQLAGAEAQLRQAEKEFQRAQQLYREKATTEQARSSAENAFHGAQAQADAMRVMLSYAVIKAPMDGVVTDRHIEAGDLANPGQLLLTMFDPQRMRLEAPVPARLIGKLPLNTKVDVKLEHPDISLRGTVTEIVSEVDAMSRTRKVKIRLEGVKGDVLPGTFGRLCIEETPHAAMLLPMKAILPLGQLEMVQVVENGHVLRRLVKTGPTHDGRVEILSGLKDGEVVLVTKD
ncbi:MAG: efflux RND transporter periplasmic adaptor subunit [Verrucomicrobia bacterium]|nr:MAG: efflux RND transporter periplasmic adaptor subunit [Verrucomicrobiota bacterium]